MRLLQQIPFQPEANHVSSGSKFRCSKWQIPFRPLCKQTADFFQIFFVRLVKCPDIAAVDVENGDDLFILMPAGSPVYFPTDSSAEVPVGVPAGLPVKDRHNYFRPRCRTACDVSGKFVYIRDYECPAFFPCRSAYSPAVTDSRAGDRPLEWPEYEFSVRGRRTCCKVLSCKVLSCKVLSCKILGIVRFRSMAVLFY